MSGNVAEWCHDRTYMNNYSSVAATDPWGTNSGSMRPLRGGGLDYPSKIRAASRQGWAPSNPNYRQGFRCVKTK